MVIMVTSGHQASQTPATRPAAAVTASALYTILSNDTEQCKFLLAGTHSLTSGCTQGLQRGFHGVITSLKQHLPAQLTAAACLARLCSVVSHCCFSIA